MTLTDDKKPVQAAADLRREAEERLQRDAAELLLPRPFEETQRLVHELQVHQIEMELQNDKPPC